jgi:hypothetical protein
MPYNRMAACTYAGAFYDKVCHDGFVATRQNPGYPKKINNVTLTPGLPFSQIGAIDREDDCTHFLSCCVGQSRGTLPVGGRDTQFPGGGLHVTSPFANIGVYGETYTPRLVGRLIILGARVVQPQFMPANYASTRTAIQQNLGPGDILAFADKTDLASDGTGSYQHICLLLSSDGKIACHTRSRFGTDYSDIYFPWVTLLKLP